MVRLIVSQSGGEIISGQTLHLVVEVIKLFSPTQIQHCALDFSYNSPIIPEFAYLQTNTIIHKPWEILPSYLSKDKGVRN